MNFELIGKLTYGLPQDVAEEITLRLMEEDENLSDDMTVYADVLVEKDRLAGALRHAALLKGKDHERQIKALKKQREEAGKNIVDYWVFDRTTQCKNGHLAQQETMIKLPRKATRKHVVEDGEPYDPWENDGIVPGGAYTIFRQFDEDGTLYEDIEKYLEPLPSDYDYEYDDIDYDDDDDDDDYYNGDYDDDDF